MKLFVFLQRRLLLGWVAALGILPILLFGYGIAVEHSASVQDTDVNLSGSLRYRSLWLYGVTQTQANAEWHSELAEMQSIRNDLSTRYPHAVTQTESAWHPFFDSFQTNGRVDWQTANTMRDAANTLTLTIEDQTRWRHQSSQWLFLFGLCTMLLSTIIGFHLVRTRSRQEETQRAAEERFRVLFEHSSDAHLLFDETGITDCNNAAIQMLCCHDKAEVLALHPAVLSPEFQPDGRRSLEKCIEMDAVAHKQGYHRFEWMHKKTDGTVFPVEVTLTPVSVAGKATLLVVWHDLTERKQAEDKLRHSERRLRDMVENLPAGAIFVAGETMFLNRAVEELTGYQREELPTLTVWFQMIYQKRAAEVQAFYEDRKAANFPDSPVVPIIRKDGAIRQVEFAAYRDADGEFWLLHDITERLLATQALEASETRLAEAQRVAHLGSYEYDIAAEQIVWSEETFRLFDRDPARGAPSQKELMTLFHVEDSQSLFAARLQAFQDGLPYAHDLRVRQSDGSYRWCRSVAKPILDDKGKPLRLVGTVLDIHERKMAEETLRQSQEALNAAQALAHIGSWELPLQTGTGTWSEEMYRLHGLPQTPKPPAFEEYLQYIHPDDRDKVARHASAHSEVDLEYRLVLPHGTIRYVHAVVEVFRDDDNTPLRMRGTLHDITEQKLAQHQIEAANEWLEEANRELESQKLELERANLKLRALATTDGLTGVANHRAFQECLAEEWQRNSRYQRPFSVILLDVDKFKLFNDSFGHPEGDRVLKTVAQALSETARETDFVARYGGEEFVILLSETEEQGACEAAERFRLAIEQQEWTLRPVTASFGVSTMTLTTESAQAMIDAADKALYHSKQAGRNRVTHSAVVPAVSALPSPIAV